MELAYCTIPNVAALIILLFTRVRKCNSPGARNGPHAAIIGLSNFHTQLVEFTKRYDTAWICIRVETPAASAALGWRRNQTTFPIKGENSGISSIFEAKKMAELQCRRHERDSFLFVSPFQMCARPKKKTMEWNTHTPKLAHSLFFFVCPSLLALFSRPPPPLSFCRTRYALTSHEHITSLLFYFSTQPIIQEQKS